MDELTLTLHHPLTDKEWDDITDVDFEHTNEITFYTKNGKEVAFAKKPHWIPCSERLPKTECNVIACRNNLSIEKMHFNPIQTTRYPKGFSVVKGAFSWRQDNVVAWMPLPEPFETKEEEECTNRL